MTKIYSLLILFFLLARSVSAQYPAEKADQRIQEIDEYILSEEYKEAISVLNELKSNNFENANLDFKFGFCYLNTIAEKGKALDYLKKASLLVDKNYNSEDTKETGAPVETYLYMGDATRIFNRFDEAIQWYKKYAAVAGTETADNLAAAKIKECHIAKVLQTKPLVLNWENSGEIINQGLGNLNAVVSGDGKIMVFTRKMKFYDAIMYTRNEQGIWQEPENITTQVGSDGEFYPTALSADGKKLLLSTYEMLSGQDIYESNWNGTRWSKLKKLDGGVNSNFTEENASLSEDGKTIFFASNRENGKGGFDIYKSEQNEKGLWGPAENLGAAVNTAQDEKYPRLMDHGKKLAFSSNGHLTMGGFDLFYIDYPIGMTSKAKNFGFPLNTVSDDLSFYPVQTENAGVVSHHENNSLGETDIVHVNYQSLSKFTDTRVKTQLEITGATDQDTLSLYLVDTSIRDTIQSSKYIQGRGALNYDLYPGKFKLVAEKRDSDFTSADFTVQEENGNEEIQMPLTLAFKPAPVLVAENIPQQPLKFQVRNIYFEFNAFEVNQNDLQLLDQLAVWLKENPTVTLTITGYADGMGMKSYNFKLSGKRAGQVCQYLAGQGIVRDRMKTLAAGSTGFIAINKNSDGSDNAEGRKFNRRVEFQFSNIPANVLIEKLTDLPEGLRAK